MDVRSSLRTIIAILVGLGLVVLFIVLLVRIFFGGNAPVPRTDISRYANTDAVVTLLADVPTNIDQDHRQVKITVSQTQNQIEILQGYQGNVITTQTYPNNSVAFGVFLQTLQQLDFTHGDDSPAKRDYRGYCPTGERYVYTFNNGSRNLFGYWSTSCHQGTFKGNAGAVLQQFRRQIPQTDFGRLTNTITIGF